MANPSVRPLPFLVSAAFVLPFGCWGQWNPGNYNVPRHCQSKIHGQGENKYNSILWMLWLLRWLHLKGWWNMMGILHVPLNAFNPSIACEYTSHPSLDSYFLFLLWMKVQKHCKGCECCPGHCGYCRYFDYRWQHGGGLWLKSLPSPMPFETPVTGMVQVAL